MSITRYTVGPIVQSSPRDLAAHDAALTQLNSEAALWSTAVSNSDAAKSALDAAQQAFDEAVAAEASARTSYEAAQATYTAAYGEVPKEDTLA